MTESTAAPDQTRLQKLLAWARTSGPNVALEVGVNFALPLLIFDLTKPHYGDVKALIASSGPPIVWSIFQLIRHRRIDAVSMLAIAGIVLGLLAFLGGGGVRALQLREKLPTVLIGLVFLGSAVIRKPLIYELARAGMKRSGSAELDRFESLRDNIQFRRVMTLMTLVWGFGLVGEAAASAAVVMAVSVHDFLIISPIMGYATMGGLSLWTFWYARRARRRGDERRAAEAAALAAQAAQAAGSATPEPSGPAASAP